MAETKIEWTNMTVNPWVGCKKVSLGCQNCYAERMAKRLKAMGVPQYQSVVDESGWTGEVCPARWPPKFPGEGAAPKMIFLGSMTDIFHEKVPFESILGLFSYMLASGGGNTFQILTKRIKRAREFFDNHFQLNQNPKFWIMSSVCNQDEADKNIPELLQIDAFVRGVSVEPMLGPINLNLACTATGLTMGDLSWYDHDNYEHRHNPLIPWVICGAETGPGARSMHPSWVRSLRDQVVGAGSRFFFKGWGEWKPICPLYAEDNEQLLDGTNPDRQIQMEASGFIPVMEDGTVLQQPDETAWILERVGKKKAGRLLDGQLWEQYPGRSEL